MIFNKLLLDSKDVIKKVLSSIDEGKLLLLTYFNQHCFNIYTKNEIYKKLIDSDFAVYQADLGIYLALKLFFKKKIKRVDATRINEIIINELIRKKYRLAIVGGNFTEGFVREKAIEKGINFSGYYNGFFNEQKIEIIIEHLNKLNAHVYILGMGVPRQEFFAEKLSQSLNSKVIICVGNFLEFYFGTKKRAPVFIQRIGLEWLFRLFSEPKRLWKRYLIGIPRFFYKIIKLKFQLIKGNQL
jgi:N-acetylglucosaminyldiphosphoundecaprenol N-acetyl-beta-D-mannosaminyltransferase